MTEQSFENINAVIVGSPDFCRRVQALLAKQASAASVSSSTLPEAWSVILSQRPNLLFVEIGVQHSERQHAALRNLISRMRERYSSEVFVCVVLNATTKFAYGGDLLFESEDDLTTSGFVDTFIATPPRSVPSIPTLSEQIVDVTQSLAQELERRSEGKEALPALGAEGWVQSLADPQSRALWMKWLPRYASYTNENPIIIGKTGTGKTNLAYALHKLSGRKGEFVTITPRDFSSSELVQAELFGAVAGAYTGAVDKWGLVKKAEKGTLFIDELQSIDKDLQGKLITFIENKTYRRVGSAESIEADVRFVFASNRTLYDMMESDVLRDDFAYRLERVHLELRPLNTRRLDITAAFAYSLAKIRRQRPQAKPVYGVTGDAYRLLFSHRWPGNLRQLENITARLCEVADMDRASIINESSVATVFESKLSGTATTAVEVISIAADRLSRVILNDRASDLDDGVEKFTQMVRLSALEATGGDIERASEMISDNEQLISLLSEAIVADKDSKLIV